jgi:hypothetical protein
MGRAIAVMAAQAKAVGMRVQLLELAQANGHLYADYYDAMLTADGQLDDSRLTAPNLWLRAHRERTGNLGSR